MLRRIGSANAAKTVSNGLILYLTISLSVSFRVRFVKLWKGLRRTDDGYVTAGGHGVPRHHISTKRLGYAGVLKERIVALSIASQSISTPNPGPRGASTKPSLCVRITSFMPYSYESYGTGCS